MTSLRILAALSILASAAASQAFVWTFNDPMDGLQEVPPNPSPATGLITGTYDDATNFLDIQWVFSGLLGVQTDAHIHRAPPGVSGGVVFPLMMGSPGTVSTMLSPAQENDLLAGLYYINIHSTLYPGGEIRGQMNPVPEPATMLALAAGLAALARRRR